MAVNFLSWNINNFSAKKNITELYEYIAQVFDTQNAHFLGLLEVQTFMGDTFGDEIGGRVNYGNVIRYQDSDQYVAHSEQYVAFWNTGIFTHKNTYDNFSPLEFPNVNERPPCIYMMDVKVGTGKQYSNIPVALFHAPGPGKSYVATACDNISKISYISGASEGILMGDFNITPSDPTSGKGASAFSSLVGLGYGMRLMAVQTSLKQVSSVASTAVFTDCLASEYDNFFVKMPTTVTVAAQRLDLISPAVTGNPAYNGAYANVLGQWHARKLGYPTGTTNTYSTIQEAFVAYRTAVSDHLPILLTLS